MTRMDVRRGSTVADVGAGNGYFTWLLGYRAGEAGKVYAVEIDEGRLEDLAEGAEERGLANVETVLGAVDDPRLPVGELDAILVFDTYHEMTEYESMLAAMLAALKPGGRLAIVDIPPEEEGLERGEYTKKHQLPSALTVAEAEAAGFESVRLVEEFIDQAGGRKFYLALFQKPGGGGPP